MILIPTIDGLIWNDMEIMIYHMYYKWPTRGFSFLQMAYIWPLYPTNPTESGGIQAAHLLCEGIDAMDVIVGQPASLDCRWWLSGVQRKRAIRRITSLPWGGTIIPDVEVANKHL